MRRDELELRRILGSLAGMRGNDPQVIAARDRVLHSMLRKVARMRALVEGRTQGRNDHEKSVTEYRVRVEFPVYSHLGYLCRINPKHVDWFCA